MRSSPYVLQALKYATLTLATAVVVIVLAAVLRSSDTGNLSGRLVTPAEGGVVNTMHFDAERAQAGFTVPADTHVIFTIPYGVRIPRITFLGGTDFDQTVRYWGYCFSGNENANKANGATGKAIYDGQFFYSLAERREQSKRPKAADNDLLGLKNQSDEGPRAPASIAEIFQNGSTCYIMSASELPAAIDSDGDDLNNKREQLAGSNGLNPDSDGDSIPDGTEVFVTKTNLLDRDTDHDGLLDIQEDKNHDGQFDRDETSPLNADTDRDGLCDGNGFGNGCPEDKKTVCTYSTASGSSRNCTIQPSSPVFGEDMNHNGAVDTGETDPRKTNTYGIDDWDYKWNLFQTQHPNSGLKQAPGTVAPAFPIPALPLQNRQ